MRRYAVHKYSKIIIFKEKTAQNTCNVLNEKAIGDIMYTVGVFEELQKPCTRYLEPLALRSLLIYGTWMELGLLHIIQELLQRQQQSHKQ